MLVLFNKQQLVTWVADTSTNQSISICALSVLFSNITVTTLKDLGKSQYLHRIDGLQHP